MTESLAGIVRSGKARQIGYSEIAPAAMGVPAGGLAIAWLLAQGEHVIPIPGTRSVEHLDELVAGVEVSLSAGDLALIEEVLPVGWCHEDRYAAGQWVGPERFC